MPIFNPSCRPRVLLARICMLSLLLLPPTTAKPQTGGTLDLRRNVIAGGGEKSTGSGNLEVTGTVGQPAAGTLTVGGALTQQGGFWSAILGIPTPTPTPNPGAGTLQFSAATYTTTEDCAAAIVTVTRSNGSTGTANVDFASTNALGFTPCSLVNGIAAQNCDFSIVSGTLTFAAGETSKTFTVLTNEDVYVEGTESINLALSNVTGGATIGPQSGAVLQIIDDDSGTPSSNPIDVAEQFVCQHYHDFLGREGDAGGFAFWVQQITSCSPADQLCINSRRIRVSNAFFFELEYQQTAAYVFRLYRAAFGNQQPFPNPDPSNIDEAKKIPSYGVFVTDRARVVAGADLAQSQLALANIFVARPAFIAKYPAMLDGPQFVDALLATVRNDLGVELASQRNSLIDQFNAGGKGAVLYRLVDDNVATNPINNRPLIDAEYNRAFVFAEYAGYLRRDSDIGGFNFWLSQVNRFPVRNVDIQHAMVCSFITSAEYQNRFSAVVTHTNSECPQ